MKVFVDSNVWVSALGTKGLCRDLVQLMLQRQGAGLLTVCISNAVLLETQRILGDKFGVTDEALVAAREVMSACAVVEPGDWQAPPGFPDLDDAPLIAAALAVGAGWFVTGDKALLGLNTIEVLPILAPRQAYAHLRGLI